MAPEKTVKERLSIIETEIIHIKDNLKNITENHLTHIYDKLDKLELFCADLKGILAEIKRNSKSHMTGKDKAAVYAALIAAIAAVVTALAAAWPK